MSTQTVYFAHPKVHYDTDFEIDCIAIIMDMLTPIGTDIMDSNIELFNPNQKILSDIYKARKEAGDEDPFALFREIARVADIVVGVTFFDGSIGAGVAEELDAARKEDKETYLIHITSRGTKVFMPFISLDHFTVLSIEETRKRTLKGDM
jgi:hypothetical protein